MAKNGQFGTLERISRFPGHRGFCEREERKHEEGETAKCGAAVHESRQLAWREKEVAAILKPVVSGSAVLYHGGVDAGGGDQGESGGGSVLTDA